MFAPLEPRSVRDALQVPTLLDDWEADEASILALETELRDLSRTYRIYRCPQEHPSQPGKDFCGATDLVSVGRTATIYSGISEVMFHIVGRYYFDHLPLEEQQNMFVSLAITLVHELAHALNLKRYSSCIDLRGVSGLPIGSDEPLYRKGETIRELGLRLEIELFGGEIQVPISVDAKGRLVPIEDGSQGLDISIYECGNEDHAQRYRLAPVSVRALFQRRTFVDLNGQQRLLTLYLLTGRTYSFQQSQSNYCAHLHR